VHIDCDDWQKIPAYIIKDMTGRTVRTIMPTGKTTTIDRGDMPAGMYVVFIGNERMQLVFN
jgi:hypothetical protein